MIDPNKKKKLIDGLRVLTRKKKKDLTIRDLVTMMSEAGWEVHFRLEPMKPMIEVSQKKPRRGRR